MIAKMEESEVLGGYFGSIIIRRNDSSKTEINLRNNLLQSIAMFTVNGWVKDVCMTHNVAFFMVPSEEGCIWAHQIGSIFVYSLDLDRIIAMGQDDDRGFNLANIDVKMAKIDDGWEDEGNVPELAHLEMLQMYDVKKLNAEKNVEKLLICATDRSCFLVRNTDQGPSMYRIFSENKKVNTNLQIIQLGFSEAVRQLSAGNDHLLILTINGNVYSMGTGSRGELGHGTLECEQQPRPVEGLGPVRVIQVACGGWHSVALTDDGDVYVWGWNKCGQLGECCRVGEILDIPVPLEINESIVAVAARRNGTLLRQSDNSVLTLGSGSFICC